MDPPIVIENISLNKMFLFTKQLLPLMEAIYIVKENTREIAINYLDNILNYLDNIYKERAISGIDIVRDNETVSYVPLTNGFKQLNDYILSLYIDDDSRTSLLNALYCLAYAYDIHNKNGNTLFLNPFFFSFHRAFIGPDGVHDLKPRGNIKGKLWNVLEKNKKDYKQQLDLYNAILNTCIKPRDEWCDNIGIKYLKSWDKMTAESGHSMIDYSVNAHRIFANVKIPQSQAYVQIDDFETNQKDNFISQVGDSSNMKAANDKSYKQIKKEKQGGKKKTNNDDDEEDDDDVGGELSEFDDKFIKSIKKLFISNESGYGVVDCAGPNTSQFMGIINAGELSSIVSGTLDSSSGSNKGLTTHLGRILKSLNYDDATSLCILLPEASIKDGTQIKEVMQKIVINNLEGNERKMKMTFELWRAPSDVHCPIRVEGIDEDNVVIIENDDKCPGVNETIQYIFSQFGIENKSILSNLSKCLFGCGGIKDLNADIETSTFLNKYQDAFIKLGLKNDMQELGGCLFRVKTMGDFYRLADTALIKYLIESPDKFPLAILGTCDGYNAINAYASNNFPTIYGKSMSGFSCYSPNTLTSKQLEAQSKSLEITKRERAEEEEKRFFDILNLYYGKWKRPESKIQKSYAYLKSIDFKKELEELDKVIKTYGNYIFHMEMIGKFGKYKVIGDIYKSIEEDNTRARPNVIEGYKTMFNNNRKIFLDLSYELKNLVIENIFVFLTLYYLKTFYLDKINDMFETDPFFVGNFRTIDLKPLIALNEMPFNSEFGFSQYIEIDKKDVFFEAENWKNVDSSLFYKSKIVMSIKKKHKGYLGNEFIKKILINIGKQTSVYDTFNFLNKYKNSIEIFDERNNVNPTEMKINDLFFPIISVDDQKININTLVLSSVKKEINLFSLDESVIVGGDGELNDYETQILKKLEQHAYVVDDITCKTNIEMQGGGGPPEAAIQKLLDNIRGIIDATDITILTCYIKNRDIESINYITTENNLSVIDSLRHFKIPPSQEEREKLLQNSENYNKLIILSSMLGIFKYWELNNVVLQDPFEISVDDLKLEILMKKVDTFIDVKANLLDLCETYRIYGMLMGFIINGYVLENQYYGMNPEPKKPEPKNPETKLNSFIHYDINNPDMQNGGIDIGLIINKKIKNFLLNDTDLEIYNFNELSEKSIFAKKLQDIYSGIGLDLNNLFNIVMILNSNTIFELHEFVSMRAYGFIDLFNVDKINRLMPVKNDDDFDIDEKTKETDVTRRENENEIETKSNWGKLKALVRGLTAFKNKSVHLPQVSPTLRSRTTTTRRLPRGSRLPLGIESEILSEGLAEKVRNFVSGIDREESDTGDRRNSKRKAKIQTLVEKSEELSPRPLYKTKKSKLLSSQGTLGQRVSSFARGYASDESDTDEGIIIRKRKSTAYPTRTQVGGTIKYIKRKYKKTHRQRKNKKHSTNKIKRRRKNKYTRKNRN